MTAAVAPSSTLWTYPFPIAPAHYVVGCCVPGNPGVKSRPRFAKQTGAVFTPAATKAHEREIGWVVKATLRAWEVNAMSLFGVRLAFSVRDQTRRDLDNMIKLVLDALTGIVWHDDAQVHELMAWRTIDRVSPRTELLVYSIPSPKE